MWRNSVHEYVLIPNWDALALSSSVNEVKQTIAAPE